VLRTVKIANLAGWWLTTRSADLLAFPPLHIAPLRSSRRNSVAGSWWPCASTSVALCFASGNQQDSEKQDRRESDQLLLRLAKQRAVSAKLIALAPKQLISQAHGAKWPPLITASCVQKPVGTVTLTACARRGKDRAPTTAVRAPVPPASFTPAPLFAPVVFD
jgi:hypothetical protein